MQEPGLGVLVLEILVPDLAVVAESFDHIKVQKSESGASGPWVDLTAATQIAAKLVAANAEPYDLDGTELQLYVDSLDAIVVRLAGNALTTDQVVAQIELLAPGVATNESGQLALQSLTTGTLSRIRVSGSSLEPLGWVTEPSVQGADAYIALVTEQASYTFQDQNGEVGDYYRTACYNVSTQALSTWSDPVPGSLGSAIAAEHLSVGTVDMVSATGVLVQGQVITIHPQGSPVSVGDYQVTPVRTPVQITTDSRGHAEVTLVRGLNVRVVFEGTTLIRDLVVPDTASFDLLSLLASSPDPFNVVSPPYPDGAQRAL